MGRLLYRASSLKRARSSSHTLSDYNRALFHYDRLELVEAIAYAERAIAQNSDFVPAHLLIAFASLLQGDYTRGWREYEWRAGGPEARSHIFEGNPPLWEGQPLENRALLLLADQGHGDVIHFSRYIPWAARRCRNLIMWCRKDAASLLVQQKDIYRLIAGGPVARDFAAWAPLSRLPRLAGTGLDTIPARVPYFRADPHMVATWARRLNAASPSGSRRVGIVWAGHSSHPNDRNRSMPLADLTPLGDVPGVTLVSLQKGAAQAQIFEYRGRGLLLDLGKEISDYADTAAIIKNLDVLVTVDTSVAHLAGAMGEPAWLMLPFAPDWRWLLKRSDSPWYPTLYLFRQPKPGRWDLVVSKIKRELARGFTVGPSPRERLKT
jgi:hypothetical protein